MRDHDLCRSRKLGLAQHGHAKAVLSQLISEEGSVGGVKDVHDGVDAMSRHADDAPYVLALCVYRLVGVSNGQ